MIWVGEFGVLWKGGKNHEAKEIFSARGWYCGIFKTICTWIVWLGSNRLLMLEAGWSWLKFWENTDEEDGLQNVIGSDHLSFCFFRYAFLVHLLFRAMVDCRFPERRLCYKIWHFCSSLSGGRHTRNIRDYQTPNCSDTFWHRIPNWKLRIWTHDLLSPLCGLGIE